MTNPPRCLFRAVDALRAQGAILGTCPIPKEPRKAWPRKRRISGMLERAYLRPCFMCREQGDCGHREPEVEFALLAAREAMAELQRRNQS